MRETEELYRQMLAVFEEKTGFAMEDEADLAVRLYAAAAEIESLYAYAEWSLGQSFPQTAVGEYLDRHAALRGITRKSGTRAVGVLRFRIDEAAEEDIFVERGTVCTTAGLVRFATTADGVIEAGSLYADIPAMAEQTGNAGNAGAETIIYMTKAPVGVTGVMNPTAFSGGSDEEDDEALRGRVIDSFRRLPNGANAAFYEQRAMRHEGVAAAVVLPRHQGIGTVGVVIAGEDGAPDAALLQEVQEDLQQVREIAVDVTVLAPTEQTVNVRVKVTPADGVSFQTAAAAAEAAITGCFGGKLLGKPLYRAALGQAIYATGMVKNYEIVLPATDVTGGERVLPILGDCEVAEA